MELVLILAKLLGLDISDLKRLAREQGEKEARKLVLREVERKMTRAVPRIARRLQEEGKTDPTAVETVRAAQYWLWKAVVRSGDVADGFRDAQDDKVVPRVQARVDSATPLAQVVRLTAEETQALTF